MARWCRALGPNHGLLLAGVAVLPVLAGCKYVPNYFRETGPSTTAVWPSATAIDVMEHYEPAPLRQRDWPELVMAPESGRVYHWPLWFEDPFEDKGHGRSDVTDYHNVWHAGWEDYVALPYSYARYTANWLLFPVSAIVTPPWTVMVSDGQVSQQLLGCDHDAIPLKVARSRNPLTDVPLAPTPAPIDEQPPAGAAFDRPESVPAVVEAPAGGYPHDPDCLPGADALQETPPPPPIVPPPPAPEEPAESQREPAPPPPPAQPRD
ncbi:MAG: hypothetical protein AB1716_03400 [Planctomycetota bacterium]